MSINSIVLSFLILNGSTISVGFNLTTLDKIIYSEDYQTQYNLKSNGLVDFICDGDNVVKTILPFDNPFRKIDSDVYFYVTNPLYNHRFLTYIGEELFDLETNEIVDVDYNGYDGYEGVAIENIPVYATEISNAYYFKYLGANFSHNKYGTCGLVAAEILFGYYDTFHSDHVVEERYDICEYENLAYPFEFLNSPGADNRNNVFHDYLLNLFINNQSFDPQNVGMTVIHQNHFINHYIGTIRNLSYSNDTSEGNWADFASNRHQTVIRNAIDNDHPAILASHNHFTVAFAYDDTYIYVHSGWYGPYVTRIKWSDYVGNIFTNGCCGAYRLILSSPHVCSNNYYSYVSGEYICPIH